jgi:hypothetical protein
MPKTIIQKNIEEFEKEIINFVGSNGVKFSDFMNPITAENFFKHTQIALITQISEEVERNKFIAYGTCEAITKETPPQVAVNTKLSDLQTFLQTLKENKECHHLGMCHGRCEFYKP